MVYSGNSLTSGPDGSKRKVSYFYDSDMGKYYYGVDHPMKPYRIRMTHSLIVGYGLHEKMEVCTPRFLQKEDLGSFHADDYINFLQSVTPDKCVEHVEQLKRFNMGEECPVFYGLYNYCQSYAGGSVGAAVKLNYKDADIAINWSGGLHHAKCNGAAGFCYINDIVLAILELLKVHQRVLYIDIDAHHGDGVEEAFYITDRVMTLSFHGYDGNYFPGTGNVDDIGSEEGKYYSLNVPLKPGIDDESYKSLFRPIIQKVMEVYQPEAVVLQCGADSLSHDRLGCFNLSIQGHADCVSFLRSFNVPLMLLGGGGYTISNVSRCWCYETAVAVGVEPIVELPEDQYYKYYMPDFKLFFPTKPGKNFNSTKDLEQIRNIVLERLGKIQHVPSVQFQERPSTTNFSKDGDNENQPKSYRWNGAYCILDSDSEED